MRHYTPVLTYSRGLVLFPHRSRDLTYSDKSLSRNDLAKSTLAGFAAFETTLLRCMLLTTGLYEKPNV